MQKPLNYFDLVVATVRGKSPIPEYQNLAKDHSDLAENYLKSIKTSDSPRTKNYWINLLLKLSPRLLNKAWGKMSPNALTMCGEKSIQQLIEALVTIQTEKIPGDFIETGVWRGGLPLIMRAHLHSVADTQRTVWLADSFQGLPHDSTDSKDQLAHTLLKPLGYLKTQRQEVEKAFEFFGLLDHQVKFLEGWFKDTLPSLNKVAFSLVRLDGDYYESTRDAITALYPNLSQGGYLIVDDFNLPLGCKRAILEYREQNQITEPMVKINRQAVYWRKGIK